MLNNLLFLVISHGLMISPGSKKSNSVAAIALYLSLLRQSRTEQELEKGEYYNA
jgi:hypothetical protein